MEANPVRNPFPLLIFALLTLPVASAALPLPQDDAGSGRDAGSSPATAVPVEPGRTYEGLLAAHLGPGSLLFGDSSDWYAFDAPAGAVLEARVDGAAGCLYLRDAAGAELAADCALAGAWEATLVRLLVEPGRYHLEYGALLAEPYAFSFQIDGPAPDPRASPTDLPQDDAGSGGDAGNDAAHALPIRPGVAYSGSGGTLADGADWYAFEAEAGDAIDLRWQNLFHCARLHRPDGSEAETACSVAYVEYAATRLEADATGTWTIQVNLVEPNAYWFSIGVGDVAAADPLVDTRPESVLDAVDRAQDPPQDDAGSGQDAPDYPEGALPIGTGIAHRAQGSVMDPDWYAFEAQAGQRIRLEARAVLGCFTVHDPDLVEAEYVCPVGYAYMDGGVDFVAAKSGTWRIEVHNIVRDTYAFSVGLDARPPPVGIPL